MQSVEMKNFSFEIFYNETELVQKFGYYIIATEKMRIGNVKQFVLRNKKAIIHERNDGYRNIKIF